MTVVVNDESKHSTFSRINIVICFIPCGGPTVICFIPCGGPTVICFIPCGSRAADPLDGHRNVTGRTQFGTVVTLFVAGYLTAGPWGWPSIFYSTGLCGVLWAVAWLFLGANSPDTHPSISDSEREYIKAAFVSSSDQSSENHQAYLENFLLGFTDLKGTYGSNY
ncbi:hypothetical protein J6590_104634 [Homalodisca vitripennis]|nr:hypothetical protein J6590_104634 [Homalodisca vitripennis]